nr:NfeD family protein [Acanthopleuribacter pedis]
MVDEVQADFIIAQLDKAEAEGFTRIILKIDTYGGVVMHARTITERLLRLKIPTTAYVTTKAISAGTFIAYACDTIVMESNTTLGDAQMIMQTTEGIKEAPEKAVTVFRADWRKACDIKNRSFALARGFFEIDVEVLQVGKPEDLRFMTREDYEFLAEKDRPPIIKIVVKKGELLTLFAKEAQALGIATEASSFEAFLKSEGLRAADLEEQQMTFSQNILRFLGANSWVFLILTMVGLNGIYMEIKMPGFGAPGLTAVVCFTIVFGSRFLLGTASPLELAVFVAGILCCLAEIFVLPGFGVAGITGMVLMFASLVFASLPDFGGPLPIPRFEMQWEWLRSLLWLTASSFLLSFLLFGGLVTLILKSPVKSPLVLAHELTSNEGVVAAVVEEAAAILGREGVIEGGLRPGGKMRLDQGKLIDVVSEVGFIDDGQRVVVDKLDGNRVVVRPV